MIIFMIFNWKFERYDTDLVRLSKPSESYLGPLVLVSTATAGGV